MLLVASTVRLNVAAAPAFPNGCSRSGWRAGPRDGFRALVQPIATLIGLVTVLGGRGPDDRRLPQTVWAPGVSGAVVVSMRGGDFEFNCGQDISVGYASHDTETVSLYLEESYSFRVLTPEAAVAIAPPKGR
jgi:Encapsulating protein for peroxidase